MPNEINNTSELEVLTPVNLNIVARDVDALVAGCLRFGAQQVQAHSAVAEG